jgi:hypothetical protein
MWEPYRNKKWAENKRKTPTWFKAQILIKNFLKIWFNLIVILIKDYIVTVESTAERNVNS